MLSLGYFSLHEQREVTRSCEAGAKALLSCLRFHDWPLTWPFDYRVGTGIQGKPEQGRKQGQRLSLPYGARATLTSHSAVEELFFARAKKRGPKKHAPASAPSPRSGLGPLRRWDFSTRHPCRVEKRRASMRAALRVIPVGSVAAEGDPEVKNKSTSTSTSNSNSTSNSQIQIQIQIQGQGQGQSQSQSQSQSLYLVTLNGGAAARAASSRLPRRAPRQKQKRRPRRRRPGSRERRIRTSDRTRRRGRC